MNILSVDFDKINLDDVDFYEDDPEALIHVRLLTWHNKFEKQKACKKDKKKQIINACSMTSNKMVGLAITSKTEKRSRTIFYW